MDKDFIKFAIAVTALVITCFTVTVIGVIAVDSVSCKNKWEESGYAHHYGFFTGCMIRDTDGTWLPANVVRIIKP